MQEIKKVSLDEADKIIETREPRGKFYTIEKSSEGKNVYVGIDNEDGYAWCEDFKSLASCKRWLQG